MSTVDADDSVAAATPGAPRPWWLTLLIRAGRTLALLSICLIAILVLFENHLIYAPMKFPIGDWDAASHGDPHLKDVELRAADGTRLHAWYAKVENPRATILYFHGNAGNLTHRVYWIRALSRLPADVFALDYRGFGKSDGSPDESGIYQDADAAFKFLVQEQAVNPRRLIVYGKSLGGGPACNLVLKQQELGKGSECGGLVIQSSFTSIPDMARRLIPIFPVHWFISTEFNNLEKVAHISAPKLFIHARNDPLIPYTMAERMHTAAAGPKQIKLFDVGGHNDLIDRRPAEIRALFLELIKQMDEQ